MKIFSVDKEGNEKIIMEKKFKNIELEKEYVKRLAKELNCTVKNVTDEFKDKL